MCLIIDTNVVSRVFFGASDPDFSSLHGCLFGNANPRVEIAYGGQLRREYLKNRKVATVLRVMDQAGRAAQYPDKAVDAETDTVENTGLCVSDDPHVIALAKVSGARVLCSHDKDLHTDFTNKALLDSPRGKVYQESSHDHLLKAACT